MTSTAELALSVRPSSRRYDLLAGVNLAVLVTIAGLETLVPNAARFAEGNPAIDPTEFIAPLMRWHLDTTDPAHIAFSYPLVLAVQALAGLGCALLARFVTRPKLVQPAPNQPVAPSTYRSPFANGGEEPGGQSAEAFTRAQALRAAAVLERIVEPAFGAILSVTVLWLVCVVAVGKLDLPWTRSFLAPPVLVTQTLQTHGAMLARAVVQSAGHLAVGMIVGTSIGVLFGFLLAQWRIFALWSHWQVIAAAALPPFFLEQVFQQVAAKLTDPTKDMNFKVAMLLATWVAIWPALTATSLAVATVDPEFRFSVALLGAPGRMQQVRFVDWPAIRPPVLRNLRISFAIGLIVVIQGEKLGASKEPPTLGYAFHHLLGDAWKVQNLVALILFTSLLVLAFELLRGSLERATGSATSIKERRPNFSAAHEDQRRALTPYEKERESLRTTEPRTSTCVIEVARAQKSYGGNVAFREPNLRRVMAGEIVSVVGRSGQGKTTLLKLLLGLVQPEQGNVRVLARNSADGPIDAAKGMDISYVAQKPLLLPDLTAEQNILFGIRHDLRRLEFQNDPARWRYLRWLLSPRGVPPSVNSGADPATDWRWMDRHGRPTSASDTPLGWLVQFFGLADKMGSRPAELSGGEAQRVHLLRWVCLNRPILMLDESFSALDQPLKGMVRDALMGEARFFGVTVIYVSHDRGDVLQMSDRVWFVDDHRIKSDSTPTDLFFNPVKRELAVFLGHTNLFRYQSLPGGRSILISRDDYRGVDFSEPEPLDIREPVAARRGLGFAARSDVNIRKAADGPFVIEDVRFTGTHYEMELSRRRSPDACLKLQTVIQADEVEAVFGDLQDVHMRGGLLGQRCDVEVLRLRPLLESR